LSGRTGCLTSRPPNIPSGVAAPRSCCRQQSRRHEWTPAAASIASTRLARNPARFSGVGRIGHPGGSAMELATRVRTGTPCARTLAATRSKYASACAFSGGPPGARPAGEARDSTTRRRLHRASINRARSRAGSNTCSARAEPSSGIRMLSRTGSERISEALSLGRTSSIGTRGPGV
jgi:hypothetical protein